MKDRYDDLIEEIRSSDTKSSLLSLSDDDLLRRIFKNIRGRKPDRAGLRLTHDGMKLIRPLMRGYEVTVPPLSCRAFLYLENYSRHPYYYSRKNNTLVVFDDELGVELMLRSGDLESLMNMNAWMIPRKIVEGH